MKKAPTPETEKYVSSGKASDSETEKICELWKSSDSETEKICELWKSSDSETEKYVSSEKAPTRTGSRLINSAGCDHGITVADLFVEKKSWGSPTNCQQHRIRTLVSTNRHKQLIMCLTPIAWLVNLLHTG